MLGAQQEGGIWKPLRNRQQVAMFSLVHSHLVWGAGHVLQDVHTAFLHWPCARCPNDLDVEAFAPMR